MSRSKDTPILTGLYHAYENLNVGWQDLLSGCTVQQLVFLSGCTVQQLVFLSGCTVQQLVFFSAYVPRQIQKDKNVRRYLIYTRTKLLRIKVGVDIVGKI